MATAERMSGLRDSVPVGTQLTMSAGSAAQVLLAWGAGADAARAAGQPLLSGRTGRGPAPRLGLGRRAGGGRGLGVGPGPLPSGKVIAAVSVSGPIERLSRQPGRLHAPAVIAAAERLSEVLRRNGGE